MPLKDRAIIDSIHALGAPIATTNYDDLLTRGRGIARVPEKAEPARLGWRIERHDLHQRLPRPGDDEKVPPSRPGRPGG